MITKKWKKSYQPIYPIFFWAYNTKNIYFASPLISLEIMKKLDEKEMKKKKNQTKNKRKTNKDRKEQGEQKLQRKGES